MDSGFVDQILLEHMMCVSFVHHVIYIVLHTLLTTSHKASLLGSSLGFWVPGPRYTRADVSLILFANLESSKSFSSGSTSGGDAPTPCVYIYILQQNIWPIVPWSSGEHTSLHCCDIT